MPTFDKARVGVCARVSNAVFGAPSASRANGAADPVLLPLVARTRNWTERRAETPVYAVDRRGALKREKLPRIWISEPCTDREGARAAGRIMVASYPCGPDDGGWRALEWAERLMGEARALSGEESRTRCDLFRASEILLLHAAQRKNVEAYAHLAWIYEHDACEGRYWVGWLQDKALHARADDVTARAFGWRAKAAARGHVGSCCAIARTFADVRASLSEQRRARILFKRAFGVATAPDRRDVAGAGEAALGLAYCSELGIGCEQSFENALMWYGCAQELLEEALEAGCWRCKRGAATARVSAARMRQEIAGGY